MASSIDSVITSAVKCGQCRTGLNLKQFDTKKHANLVAIEEEDLPDWIAKLIDESGWTKGKILCPKCLKGIGGFDFVSGSTTKSAKIYLVKSKVDVHLLATDTILTDSRYQQRLDEEELLDLPILSVSGRLPNEELNHRADPSVSLSSSLVASQSSAEISSASSTETSPGIPKRLTSASKSKKAGGGEVAADSTSENNMMDEDDTEEEDETQHRVKKLNSLRQKNRTKRKIKRRRRRGGIRDKKTEEEEEKKDKLKKLILFSEPELDGIPDNLVCPVCLDLLHDPFIVKPCLHVFCEVCLRRLGMKNAMNTPCPLCRTAIAICLPESDLTAQVRANYPFIHGRRKKCERNSNVYNFPLPWKPGWRSFLIYGRPLGGNRFPNETLTAFLMRIMWQIPYFVPPVVLANLVNLVLLVLILGTFEIVPLFMKTVGGVNNKEHQIQNSLNQMRQTSQILSYQGSYNQNVCPGKYEQFQLMLMDFAQRKRRFQNYADRPLKSPEMLQLSMMEKDASLFYFAMAISSILVAIISNFLLAQQNLDFFPAEEEWFISRMLTRFARLRRFSSVEFALVLSALVLVSLPIVVPATQAMASNTIIGTAGPNQTKLANLLAKLGMQFSLKPYFLLLVTVFIGSIYWIGVIVLERDIIQS